jgi:hypothetical protein
LIRRAIRKVLSTLSTHQVRYLLMGGQACVLYGAAEFSRDCDIAILCEPQNLSRLQEALDELQARTIAVPPFEADYLLRGHAVHFRCHASGVEDIRLDVMARMRGVSAFDELWSRRTTIDDESSLPIEVMSLPDLVTAKMQRDKDWPMIRRLVGANYSQHRDSPNEEQIKFWLLESRTPETFIEAAAQFPEAARSTAKRRPLLTEAIAGSRQELRSALTIEREAEEAADRGYWEPLKRELEKATARPAIEGDVTFVCADWQNLPISVYLI